MRQEVVAEEKIVSNSPQHCAAETESKAQKKKPAPKPVEKGKMTFGVSGNKSHIKNKIHLKSVVQSKSKPGDKNDKRQNDQVIKKTKFFKDMQVGTNTEWADLRGDDGVHHSWSVAGVEVSYSNFEEAEHHSGNQGLRDGIAQEGGLQLADFPKGKDLLQDVP